ncbi:MAG: glycosyltransferase [Niabella sp.]
MNFPSISLLVTHYNRSRSLELLLQSFRKLNCSFGEIVVSDDGSKPEHIAYLQQLQPLFGFKLITAEKNKGLGNNINKGQDAVTLPYTLYVQEDFEPQQQLPQKLAAALNFMEQNSRLDFVRFYAYIPYPYVKPFKDNFSEMHLPFWGWNTGKIYIYSDHPHLRRSSFLSKFGRYAEGLKGDRTEYRMCISVLQKKAKGLFYNDYQALFVQKNTETEPSTMKRESWRMSNNFFLRNLRNCYRQIKYNYDILFMKP